jgi:hypothetical protein
MFPARRKLFAFALAVVATCAFTGVANAGWVTFKNDTKNAIVVQEVVIVNGKQVRGKPTKLLAGESFREFQNTAGVKSYEIYDTSTPPTGLWKGNLSCKADSQTFSVTTVNGQTAVNQATETKKP